MYLHVLARVAKLDNFDSIIHTATTELVPSAAK